MKKISFICALLFAGFGFAQKKPVRKAVAPTNIIVAKADNLSAEVVKDNFYLFINGPKKDTILIKTITPKKLPADGKITPFKSKGVQLYVISWTEVANSEVKLKKESAVTTFTEIYDVASKTEVFSNAQTTTTITEVVYLDTKQTVSETQQKVRKEGFEFSLMPTGDISLKNKAQENKMTYSASEKKYVNAPGKKK